MNIRIRSIDCASSLWVNGLTLNGSHASPSLVLESKWLHFDRQLYINAILAARFIEQLSTIEKAEHGSATLEEEYGEQTLSLHAENAGTVEVRCAFVEHSDQEMQVHLYPFNHQIKLFL